MQVVGHFLAVLFQDHTLPRRCSTKDSMSLPRHLRSLSRHSAQPLYACPTYSQLDFIRLILSVFSGIPEAYQVLHCQATTTEEQLNLFLKRVERHQSQYLMLAVNKLPFKLQEVSQAAQQREGIHVLSLSSLPPLSPFSPPLPSLSPSSSLLFPLSLPSLLLPLLPPSSPPPP